VSLISVHACNDNDVGSVVVPIQQGRKRNADRMTADIVANQICYSLDYAIFNVVVDYHLKDDADATTPSSRNLVGAYTN